jgi:hypothetical protein
MHGYAGQHQQVLDHLGAMTTHGTSSVCAHHAGPRIVWNSLRCQLVSGKPCWPLPVWGCPIVGVPLCGPGMLASLQPARWVTGSNVTTSTWHLGAQASSSDLPAPKLLTTLQVHKT